MTQQLIIKGAPGEREKVAFRISRPRVRVGPPWSSNSEVIACKTGVAVRLLRVDVSGREISASAFGRVRTGREMSFRGTLVFLRRSYSYKCV